ncbi:MAG: hypothetical protein NTZ17_05625 [Phycisphaerae bacterium]|nr:hypothetical protein [Phycisphaerae bacterium]
MDSEELKAYEKAKRAAARQVDEWFTDDPWLFWRDKAREILEQCEAYERGESTFHPILRWMGTPTDGKADIAEFTEKYEDEGLLCYYAACIILHDTAGQGYTSIAADIWPGYEEPKSLPTGQDQKESWRVYGRPETIWNLASYVFHPAYSDKTEFIQAARRAVEKDLPVAAIRRLKSHGEAERYLEGLREIEQGFYAVVPDVAIPHRTYMELKRYRRLILDDAELWSYAALEPDCRWMNQRIMKMFVNAALEVRHHFPECHLPDVPILADDHIIEVSDFLRLEQWFLAASELTRAASGGTGPGESKPESSETPPAGGATQAEARPLPGKSRKTAPGTHHKTQVSLDKFNAKTKGSYPFLEDLLSDLKGEHVGIPFDEKKHGTRKNQPKMLRNMLKGAGLEWLAKAIKKVKGRTCTYRIDLSPDEVDIVPCPSK